MKAGCINQQNMKGKNSTVIEQALQDKYKIIYTGFEAQEVEKAAASIGYNFSGVDKPKNDQESFYGLRYSDFVAPLVKAVQEQQLMIEDLKKEVIFLKSEMENLKK